MLGLPFLYKDDRKQRQLDSPDINTDKLSISLENPFVRTSACRNTGINIPDAF